MKRLSLAFLFISGSACGFAQDQKLSPLENLKAEIYRLQDDADLIHGGWGLCVLDLKKDSVISEYNSATGFVPASSLKVLTTATALSQLGENFRYETKIQYDGTLDSINGVIYGNLYIRGSGDPSLGSKYFAKEKDTISISQRWTRLLISKGITKIEGSVVGDASVFEQDVTPDTWIWGDMGNYYGSITATIYTPFYFKVATRVTPPKLPESHRLFLALECTIMSRLPEQKTTPMYMVLLTARCVIPRDLYLHTKQTTK
jgi:D-alanyl-D-alanine carboxypeptidase/D-alanyl-D-alanine-endopeptidase (penicillin-binding protein 4)